MQRRLTWLTLFSVAIVVPALYHARKVHATPVHVQDGCSVASLKGTYAFRRTGVNNVLVGGPIAQIGIDVHRLWPYSQLGAQRCRQWRISDLLKGQQDSRLRGRGRSGPAYCLIPSWRFCVSGLPY
jgi:hypothetical protein